MMRSRNEEALEKQIRAEMHRLAGLGEIELYLELSNQHVRRIQRETFENTLRSLEPEDRAMVEEDLLKQVGLFGQFSPLIDHVDRDTATNLRYIARLQPTVEDGEALLARILRQLRDLLCDDWKYCAKRKEYKDDLKLLAAAATVAIKTLSLEVGVATAALLVLTLKGPDFFCKCTQREAANAGL